MLTCTTVAAPRALTGTALSLENYQRLIRGPVAIIIIIVIVWRIYHQRTSSEIATVGDKPEIQSCDVMGDENVPPGRLSAMGSLRKVSEL